MNKNMFRRLYIPILSIGILLFNCYGVNGQSNLFSDFVDSSRINKIRKTLPKIDSIYKAIAIKNNYPGLSYGIVVDGRLFHSGNYGYTDVLKKIPATSKSMFRIASMSKSVTAMAIMHLKEAGKIQLDDPVEKYIPEFKLQNTLTNDAPLVSIRHCLTHSAGFPEDNPWGDRQLQDSDEELSELLKNKVSFSTIPDYQYEYSNLGYALLGRIITLVSGMPYQDYIKKHILFPLGMPSTDWEYDRVSKDQLAHGYRWLDGKYVEEQLLHDHPNGSWGAMGSMISSIEEFAQYMACHLKAWPPRSDQDQQPIKRQSIREMHKPWNFSHFNPAYIYPDGRQCATANAYGYGLRWTKDCDDKTYIGHSGGLPGFGSHWMVMPEYGIGVISLANRTYAGTSGVNMQVIDAIVKQAELKPRNFVTSKILQQRKLELMSFLPDWKNAQNSKIFAENFFPDFILEKLRNQSQELYLKIGTIKKVHDLVPENNLRGSFIIEGANGSLQVYYTLSPENPPLIQDYRLTELR
jgi:CubicO group peptidase (beta-lactamase class C family)